MYKLLGKWDDESAFQETNFKVYSKKSDAIEWKSKLLNLYLDNELVSNIHKTRLGGVIEFRCGLVKEYRIVKLKL